MSSTKGRVRIKCKSFDKDSLKKVVSEIIRALLRAGSKIKGPVPLPTRITRYTVTRSPHIDKTSREHFERKIYAQFIDIINYNAQTMSLLKDVELDSKVDIEIKS